MSFNLKNFIEDKFKSLIDGKYKIQVVDEQQESYEGYDDCIIFIVKALNGIVMEDVSTIPYQILVYSPLMQDVNENDPIVESLNLINQFVNEYSGKTITDEFESIKMTFSTASVLNPLISNSIQFRSLMYFNANIKISKNLASVKNIYVDDVRIGKDNFTMQWQSGESISTNSIANKQKIVSKNKNYVLGIAINIIPKFSYLFNQLTALRKGVIDCNTIFKVKLEWNNGSFETYNMICNSQQLTINDVTNDLTIIASFTESES